LTTKRIPPAPLLFAFLALATGIGLVILFPFLISQKLFFAIAAGGLAFAGIFAVFYKKHLAANVFILMAICMLGSYRYSGWTKKSPQNILHLAEKEVRILGDIVSEIDFKGDRQRFDFKADSLVLSDSTVAVEGIVRIYSYNGPLFAYGDRIMVKTRLREPSGASNPYAYDFRESLRKKGIDLIAFLYSGRGVKIVDRNRGNWAQRKIIIPLRNHISEAIDENMSGSNAALLKGLLLGKGRELPDKVRDAFADSGTIHILAVSGLHVGLIAGFAWLIFASIFRIPRPISVFLVVLMLVIYVGLVGGRASVIRASLMFSIILIGTALSRPSNLLNSIGAAGFILLLIKPVWLSDLGFQLSFGATLGIAYLMPVFDDLLPDSIHKNKFVSKWIVTPLQVSIAATLGTGPLIAYYFHRVQIIAPIANLVVIPPLGLIVGYGVLGSLFHGIPVLNIFADCLLRTDRLLTEVLLFTVNIFARPSFAYLPFKTFPPIWIGVYYLCLLLIANLKRSKLSRIGVSIIAVGLIAFIFFGSKNKQRTRITFFDIGQGDCALVEFCDGREILIDGGPPGNAAFGVAPYLQAKGYRELDAVLMTHYDADHLGGIKDLMDDFEYTDIYVNTFTRGSDLYAEFLDSVDMERVNLLLAGDSIPGFPEFEVLWPGTLAVTREGSLMCNINEASIVLMLQVDETEILFTGDIGAVTEIDMIESGCDLDCDILKVPHHGSKFSSCSLFVERTSPELAIISVGSRNRFGHPAHRVIDEYRGFGSKIQRTDRSGAITIFIDEDSVYCQPYFGTSFSMNSR